MKNTLEQLSGEFIKILGGLELNGGCNFMAKNGIEVSQCKYDYKYDYTTGLSDGLIRVVLNRKYGVIDETGREVIPCKYDAISPFYKGLARVKLNGKQGYIDKHGNWYDKEPSVLPESINKITISDIRYMVNECVKQLIQ